mmetsp:Transcript_62719/g.141605  ORF Transcript_62719/g.141605 Transcript_62719/m.141605 type:complete len:248 (-) Transcript_62719:641-1384(-)
MVRCNAAMSVRVRLSSNSIFFILCLETSMLSSMLCTDVSSMRSSFAMCMTSFAFASPLSLRMPSMNSTRLSSPSPSSRISQSSSSSFMLTPSFSNLCSTLRFLDATVSSSMVIMPLPSLSMIWKNASNCSSSLSFSLSARIALSRSSAFPDVKACSTMMAVTKFISTKTAMEMNTRKKTTTHACTAMSSRTMSDHESSVMTWKRVSIDRSTSPKYSEAMGTSLKASCFPISDVASMAKKYSTHPIMT